MRSLLPILLSAPLCQGAIVVSGDIINTGGTFEITQDITITVTNSGSWGALVFDDWVTHDGSQNGVGIAPDSITFSVNGGSNSTANTISLVDNTAGLGDLSSGDGFFALGAPGISLSAGDTLRREDAFVLPPVASQRFVQRDEDVRPSGISTAALPIRMIPERQMLVPFMRQPNQMFPRHQDHPMPILVLGDDTA